MEVFPSVKELCKMFEPNGYKKGVLPFSVKRCQLLEPNRDQQTTRNKISCSKRLLPWCMVIICIILAIFMCYLIHVLWNADWEHTGNWFYKQLISVLQIVADKNNEGKTIDVIGCLNWVSERILCWDTLWLALISMIVMLMFIVIFVRWKTFTVYASIVTAAATLVLALFYTANQGYHAWEEEKNTLARTGLGSSFMWFCGSAWIVLFAAWVIIMLCCHDTKKAIARIVAASKSLKKSTMSFALGVSMLQALVVAFNGAMALCSYNKPLLSILSILVMLWSLSCLSACRSMVLTHTTFSKKAAHSVGAAFHLFGWNHLGTGALGALATTIMFVAKTSWELYDWIVLHTLTSFIMFFIKTLWIVIRRCMGKHGKTLSAYLQLTNVHYAYIVCAIRGEDCFASGKYAFEINRRNSSSTNSGFLLLLLKLAPTFVIGAVGVAWEKIVSTIVVAIGTYLIIAELLHPLVETVKIAEFCELIELEENDEPRTSQEVPQQIAP